ncbi:MAG: 30S ribosomal protein S8 [Gammaproteobacteria bacterium RIFCSPHIGHO2_12_FULL_42_13]|nr:MAG: 30S ribosomal protein S8 [Gammaproteobacteria bacterium RIFCSPHIGHO2_12_FULL_42_13]
MSIQDPIADMLIRIKNAQAVAKDLVRIPKSKLKVAIAKVMQDEGYIDGLSEDEAAREMTITLRYFENKPVIRRLERVSRPSLRVYLGKGKLPEVDSGLGIAIVSTPQGVMTAAAARRKGLGGEVLCIVS